MVNNHGQLNFPTCFSNIFYRKNIFDFKLEKHMTTWMWLSFNLKENCSKKLKFFYLDLLYMHISTTLQP